MQQRPDCRRLLKTIHHEEYERVPLVEIGVARPIQSAFLGRPVRTLANEVDFLHRAGYGKVTQ